MIVSALTSIRVSCQASIASRLIESEMDVVSTRSLCFDKIEPAVKQSDPGIITVRNTMHTEKRREKRNETKSRKELSIYHREQQN